MVKGTESSSSGGDARDAYTLVLDGLGDEADRARLVVQALDAKGGIVHQADVDKAGRFTLPDAALKHAHRVVIGAPDDEGGVHAEASVGFHAAEFKDHVADRKLVLGEGIWQRFSPLRLCTSGRVRKCWRRPWWFDAVVAAARRPLAGAFESSRALAPAHLLEARLSETFNPSLAELVYGLPTRCAPVCLGTVEVFRRTCCCWPIVIDVGQISDLIKQLEIHVKPKVPIKHKFPPPPPPPIGDPLKTRYFKDGALNEFELNAAHDLQALRALPVDQAAQYIQGRPYLLHRFCSCGRPAKVGQGKLLLDGSFNVCWFDWWRPLPHNCYEQYAYVVKQTIGGTETTIYNGITAGAWFAAGEHPVLTTFHPAAYACGDTGTGVTDAYVFLVNIGDTDSYELATPDSTGWDRVALPNEYSGLLGADHRNLGGKIKLTYLFTPGMKAIGAKYYRIGIRRANGGNPVGTPTYFTDPVKLRRWNIATLQEEPKTINPEFPAGGPSPLYEIPYDEPGYWWLDDAPYHAIIDTRLLDPYLPADEDHPANLAPDAVNHLITLEVFDTGGNLLHPLGTSATGQAGLTETPKPFKFYRWFEAGSVSPGVDLSDVPHAALTHLFCWDNREPVADITQLVMSGLAADEECQFLEGAGDATFAIRYRAYVPDQRFQKSHSIHWVRGLNGPTGILPTPLSPTNAGKPNAPEATSGSNTFEVMLANLNPPPAVLPRCAFSVTLVTVAKTTNGDDLGYYPWWRYETAAFALSIQ